MFKWGFIMLGLFFLWGGIDNHINYSNPVNENPEIVDVGSLKQMIAAEDKHYIRFSGSIDANGRLFTTHLDYPAYTRYAPWDIQSIVPGRKSTSEFIGAIVEVALPIAGDYIEMETMRVSEDSVKTASASRFMAPLMGTNGNIWVFSAPFNSFNSDEASKKEWLSQAGFTGRLSELKNINKNYELRHKLEDLNSTYSNGAGDNIPYNALVIDTYIEGMSEGRKNKIEYYVAVKDTDNSLYVKTTKDKEASMVANNIITGVLQPKESRYYSGFKKALDLSSLPGKIGIITMESGQEVNEENFFYTKVGIIGGIIFIGLGVLIGRFSKSQK